MKARPEVLAHRRFQEARAELAGLEPAQVFGRIYETNLWGAAESVSGHGSELDATARLREMLPELMRELGVGILLDIPCGDFHWLSRVELPVERYVGADIVEAVVEANREKYGREFVRLDLCTDALPKADLVLCRDCLVHLPFEWIRRAVANLKKSGSAWLLTTHFLECGENVEIETGDWRMLNFQLAPFGWKAPERVLVEGCEEAGGGYGDKTLGLWRIDELP
jgi:hypothetical protein